MTDPSALRLGDADRDRAISLLQRHRDAGRLSDDELAQRTSAARDAVRVEDLEPLFEDLPGGTAAGESPLPVVPAPPIPSPAPPAWAFVDVQDPTPTPVWPTLPRPGQPAYPHEALTTIEVNPDQVQVPLRTRAPIDALAGLIWPIAIVLAILTGHFQWILLAIIGSAILRVLRGSRREVDPVVRARRAEVRRERQLRGLERRAELRGLRIERHQRRRRDRMNP